MHIFLPGWINSVLSWKPLVPLGRLTFCAYLIHPILMLTFYRNSQVPVHLSNVEMVTFCNFNILVIVVLKTAYGEGLSSNAHMPVGVLIYESGIYVPSRVLNIEGLGSSPR